MARFQLMNLPFGVRKSGLEAVFQQFGLVVSDIEIDHNHLQGGGHPVAFVTLDAAETARRAMYRLIGVSYLGRDLAVHEVP